MKTNMPYSKNKSKKSQPVKNPYSPESLAFRRLSRKEKYKKLLDFCEENNQTPRTYKRPEAERVIGQFLVNMRAQSKRDPDSVDKWELEYLNNASKYEIYQRDPISRLKEILRWSKINKKTPSQSSHDSEEKKLGQSLNSTKLALKKDRLNDEAKIILNKILEYRTNHQRTRAEKLGDVLEFCRNENRTPKQHVKDKTEKRLAEFLTTTKGLIKNPEFNLDTESQKLMDAILKYSPPTRESRIKELYNFVKQEKRKPSTSSEDIEERKLATYLSKMKSALKREQLSENEIDLINEILSICKIKTREEKLNDLLQWVIQNDKLPSLTTKNIEEKRFVMFLNNIKQVQKKKPKSLNMSEINMLKEINSHIKTTQEV